MKIHSFEKAKFKKLLKSEEQFAILRGNIHARNDHASVSPYHDLRITRSNSYVTYNVDVVGMVVSIFLTRCSKDTSPYKGNVSWV